MVGGHGFERCYNDLVGVESYENRMCNWCWNCLDVEYSELLTACEHCFGCIGLKHKKFCIFNQQYTEEEYWPLVDAIKTAMLQRGEYGKFFPHRLNPIAYNNSHAVALFPLAKDEATKYGMRWYSFTEEQKGEADPVSLIPDKLAEVTDEILKKQFRCPVTNRVFRFVKPELEFHRTLNIALPRVHPSARRYARAAQQFPLYLHTRTCASCQVAVQTRIPSTCPSPLLCQDCYEQVAMGEKMI